MPARTAISPEDLFDLIGTPDCPVIVDVRIDEDSAADPRFLPAAIRRPGLAAADWAGSFAGRRVVVVCQGGLKISQGAAAWLRHAGAEASVLAGGFQAWRAAGLPLVPEDRLPPRDVEGRTLWVTRSGPGVEGMACTWLVRRFVDPAAVFLFAEASQVAAVAERFGARPFDQEGAFGSLITSFGLTTAPLKKLATVLHGAASGRLDLAPEAAGLLAVSHGLSQMFSDDLDGLEAGMALFDALYRWARDAAKETHSRPAARKDPVHV